MVQAYILIMTEVGRAAAVASDVAGVDGVDWAEGVTGPYDVIVHAGAADVEDLRRRVVDAVKEIPGITRTLVCPVVPPSAAF